MEFREKLKKREITFYEDIIPAKGLKQYEITEEDYLKNILVFSAYDDEPRPVGDLLPSVEYFPDRTPVRFYFLTFEDREVAQRLWPKR